MPELPEVETTRAGIAPHILHRTITAVLVRNRDLRWPVPAGLRKQLEGQQFQSVERRGKYLLLRTASGTVICHLGMSGSLRIVAAAEPVRKHDHIDVVFADGLCLRFHDPRRFGCFLYTRAPAEEHALLAGLGPEPLGEGFDGDTLWRQASGRKAPIKTFIMDSKVVVGVGNIYANEALFRAGIHPQRAAGRVARERYQALAAAIVAVLREAIAQGGTTLRDFVHSDGQPGYFQQTLAVYDRGGEPCPRCGDPISVVRLGQRSTYFCPHCQR